MVVLSLVAVGCATITRSSETSSGKPASSSSYQPALSYDGRFLAFTSTASNLAGVDENATHDVFVRDHQTNAVELISVRRTSAHSGSAASDRPSISADGRFVAFRSLAPNLGTYVEDHNDAADIFVRDRQLGITTPVSVTNSGSEANNTSDTPVISADGRYVVFASSASNLVAGDTNNAWDVFVRDLRNNTTTLVSIRAAGGFANGRSAFPSVNSDGRYVAFTSAATNLVTGDTNGVADVFVRDVVGATTTRVSLTNGGAQAVGASGVPAISGDGRYVAFDSVAANLVSSDTNAASDVFVRDRTGATTTRASVTTSGGQATGPSDTPTISLTGRWVAFESRATNLVPADTNATLDVFVRDRTANATSRVSTTILQVQANGPSGGAPSISSDGSYVSFQSGATNLLDGDTNAQDDVFTRYLTVPKITALSPATIARGSSATVTVTGSGFLPGAVVLVPVTGVTVGAVNVLNENQLRVTISVAGTAEAATAPFWVVLLGTGLGTAKSAADICVCLAIT